MSTEQTPELVQRLLSPRAMSVVGQPIVSLSDRQVVGYEALARFSAHPDLTPDAAFAIAAAAGVGVELEMEVLKLALSRLADLAPGRLLSVNVSPEAATFEQLADLMQPLELADVVLELTEQHEVESYIWLGRVLLGLRIRGLQIAIDDVGRGFGNWGHLVHLQPDIIKLDGALIQDIEADPVRRSAVKALVGFAADIEAVVTAEEVETEAQAAVLRDLGVDWAQGYLFCRPRPFDELLDSDRRRQYL
jgi:EAL domain-containing protein (putative c-di-GMP-specific phosphodiesterase class I)